MKEQYPNLLIIGAMKCGTSSVYSDLARHPEIFFPQNKEPMGYLSVANGSEKKVRKFTQLYDGRVERYLGDASTGYSKYPVRPSVTGAVANKVAKPKIIYLTRDPIERIERHLAHNIGNGLTDLKALDVTQNLEYVCASAYQMQISYWKQAFGDSSVFVCELDEYRRDRRELLGRLMRFLDLDGEVISDMNPANTNRGDSRRSAYRSRWKKLLSTDFYASVRENVPLKLRRSIADLVLPKAIQSSRKLTKQECAFVHHALASMNNLWHPSEHKIRQVFDAAREALEGYDDSTYF